MAYIFTPLVYRLHHCRATVSIDNRLFSPGESLQSIHVAPKHPEKSEPLMVFRIAMCVLQLTYGLAGLWVEKATFYSPSRAACEMDHHFQWCSFGAFEQSNFASDVSVDTEQDSFGVIPFTPQPGITGTHAFTHSFAYTLAVQCRQRARIRWIQNCSLSVIHPG